MRPLSPAPVTVEMPSAPDHEELVVETGKRSGVTMAVAIHSTRLGPALGGARLWHYENREEGIADALRLARAMTFKAAAAGLDLGGGKGVICAPDAVPPAGLEREAILHDFGDLVDSLGGRYVTAEDVGTSTADMVQIATRTIHVTGMPEERGGAGDPSGFTALGVQAAIQAACRAAFGTNELAGRRIAIAGLGHVGTKLARGLGAAGAELVLADIDPAKRPLAAQLGGQWMGADAVMSATCDVLAPCAVGGAVHAGNIGDLRCRVVCGAANNQLADEALAGELAERGILFAPDFIANAGGLINVYRELLSRRRRPGVVAPACPSRRRSPGVVEPAHLGGRQSVGRAAELALGIEDTMGEVLARAAALGTTPLEAARSLARERLDLAPAGRVPD